jgi:hypothetical protein
VHKIRGADVTLARALARITGPGAHEDVVAVMKVFSGRAGQPVDLCDVVRLSGVSRDRARLVVQALADTLVLDFEGGEAYRYDRDVAVELELQSLIDRLCAHREHLQDNVARFRSHRGPY